jgi:predicted nucleic acid-binding protein
MRGNLLPGEYEEFNSFLQFAGELGDGEAMSLAIALHRGWVLATDDNKAAKMAAAESVETISTPEIIKDWTELDESNLANLRTVLRAIEERARFKPPRNSRLYELVENSRG